MVKVSIPSVRLSDAIGMVIVAFPSELTIAVPDKAPPVISAELTPEIVYGIEVPPATLVVVRVKTALEPSETELVEAERAYEAMRVVLEVSLTKIEADFPCELTVSVSGPSVNKSAAMGTKIVAKPLVSTVAVPIRPPVTSDELTPEIV